MWQFEQSARKGGNVCIFDPSGLDWTNWTVNIIMKYERDNWRGDQSPVPVDRGREKRERK